MNINVQPQRLSNTDLLHRPNISLNGRISADTLSFCSRSDEHLIMELNTEGGDAHVARRIAMEIWLFRRHTGREAYCVGKTDCPSSEHLALMAA